MLEGVQQFEFLAHRQAVIALEAAEHAVHGMAARLLIGVGDQDLARQPPFVAIGDAAAGGGPRRDGIPMTPHIGGVQVQAERDETTPAGELQRF
jgi:hypothetical protein